MSEEYYHVDGEIVPSADATVHVRDRGFMYGDGVFETLRLYDGTIFEWGAHADRLEAACESLGFADAVPDRAALRRRIEETLDANGRSDAYAKISVTRGRQPGTLTPDEQVEPTVVVQTADLPRGGLDGTRTWDEPGAATVVDAQPVPDAAIPTDAKTHNYLDGILARLAVRDTEYDVALRCSADGVLVEGATSNLFFVDDGRLLTPAADLPLLPGVTRGVVLDIANDLGIPVQTGRYEPERLRAADEAFVTNSTAEIRPLTRIEGGTLAVGPVTKRLQGAYDRRVEALYDAND